MLNGSGHEGCGVFAWLRHRSQSLGNKTYGQVGVIEGCPTDLRPELDLTGDGSMLGGSICHFFLFYFHVMPA